MVLSDRVVVTSYRLSLVTMSSSAAVWPQFSVESFSFQATSDRISETVIGLRLLLITTRKWHTSFYIT